MRKSLTVVSGSSMRVCTWLESVIIQSPHIRIVWPIHTVMRLVSSSTCQCCRGTWLNCRLPCLTFERVKVFAGGLPFHDKLFVAKWAILWDARYFMAILSHQISGHQVGRWGPFVCMYGLHVNCIILVGVVGCCTIYTVHYCATLNGVVGDDPLQLLSKWTSYGGGRKKSAQVIKPDQLYRWLRPCIWETRWYIAISEKHACVEWDTVLILILFCNKNKL